LKPCCTCHEAPELSFKGKCFMCTKFYILSRFWIKSHKKLNIKTRSVIL
jgi:hypothetical protein